MKWCKSCVLPDTRPNLIIMEDGRCNACHSHASKPTIPWHEREKDFVKVVQNAKRQSTGYDCIIPVSGGKDSTWQTLKCLEYGLNPLAVTWKTPSRTKLGQDNLDNLISLGVDHIDYQINPRIEAKFMVKTFESLGSTAIPMHLAIFNIPLMLAVRFKIPLIIWGENSAFEYGAADEQHTGFKLDKTWLRNYGVTHGTDASSWICDELRREELTAYFGPDDQQLSEFTPNAIFLGHYFEWDPESTASVAKANGFKFNSGIARTGYYDFADIDDDFISIHHWMKWYKFGFTRAFDNLSLEIRNGRLKREQALEILLKIGDSTPYDDIERFCSFSGITQSEFFSIAETFRNSVIWKEASDGTRYIQDFLIDNWNW